MTTSQYDSALSEAFHYSDRDAYISDLALSSIWEDESEEIPAQRLEDLGQIWDATHRTLKDILALADMTIAEFCRTFSIPKRTAQDWAAGSHQAPLYVLLMIQRILGLYTIEIERQRRLPKRRK